VKVKELIKALQKFDPEETVTIGAEGVVRGIDSVDEFKNRVIIGNED
jgi:hypothetical protein